jgi:hypothetical protein
LFLWRYFSPPPPSFHRSFIAFLSHFVRRAIPFSNIHGNESLFLSGRTNRNARDSGVICLAQTNRVEACALQSSNCNPPIRVLNAPRWCENHITQLCLSIVFEIERHISAFSDTILNHWMSLNNMNPSHNHFQIQLYFSIINSQISICSCESKL